MNPTLKNFNHAFWPNELPRKAGHELLGLLQNACPVLRLPPSEGEKIKVRGFTLSKPSPYPVPLKGRGDSTPRFFSFLNNLLFHA